MEQNRNIAAGFDRGKQALTAQELLTQLLWGAFCYLVAAGNMLEGLSPFGAALAAACPEKLLIITAIGAAGGSLFPAGVAMSMKYAAAVMLCAIARWTFFGGSILRYSSGWAPILAGFSLLAPSLLVELTGDWTSYDLFLSIAESFLAAGAAYFFSRSLELLRQGIYSIRRSDGVCALMSLCIFLLSLCAFRIGTFSLGRSVACLAVLLCAMWGEGSGCIAGAACGTAIALSFFPDTTAVGGLALCGLLSGAFSHVSKFACCAAFVLCNGLYCLLTHSPMEALPLLIESGIASMLFMCIPLRSLQKLRSRTFARMTQDRGRQLLLYRVEDTSHALRDIAAYSRELSQGLNQLRVASIEELYQCAIDGVCRQCNQNVNCWQAQFSDSMNCFNHFTEQLRKKGSISAEDFLYPLNSQCPNKNELAAIINSRYELFLQKEGLRRKVSQVRAVVTDQFDGMADMLSSFGQELLDIQPCEPQLLEKIKNYLESAADDIREVICYRSPQQQYFLRFSLPKHQLARIDMDKLTDDLGEILACLMDEAEITEHGERLQICLRELANYCLEVAYSQHICKDSSVCGDSCDSFTDRRAIAHLLISDGMGSGSGAAIDSQLTSSLIRRLLQAGVDYGSTLKIVNSALLVKSGEESLATVDIAAVDLYSGRADFYKAGAAPSFVRRHQRTAVVEPITLPVGILSAIDMEKRSVQLSAGDLLVMLSDGATTSGTEWIRHSIDCFHEEDGLQSLCDDIVTTARHKRSDNRDDDITVMAGILRKR